MASEKRRLPMNVEGPFFVDSECTDCENCRGVAPDFFKRDEDREVHYICRQPSNEEEEEMLLQALEFCPAEAIGRMAA
ncbi:MULTISPECIES: ferredoxin [unclassified Frankia]|uniref:ferredoxin n=2 Tax=unclassified Frankia TaxID=2632575 RepID=UPI002AD332DF|nr:MULTISPECIES: ferredoxin [unclassified Frankia]